VALSVNGFGTGFYGESDYRADGSFVTTEWVYAAYVPLFPVRSLRLARDESNDVSAIVFHSAAYRVAERPTLQWAQVFRVYAFIAALALWWFAARWICFTRFDIANDPRAPWIVSTWVFAMAAPIAAVVLARRFAWKRRLKNA
jgi:hypothetical protein